MLIDMSILAVFPGVREPARGKSKGNKLDDLKAGRQVQGDGNCLAMFILVQTTETFCGSCKVVNAVGVFTRQ